MKIAKFWVPAVPFKLSESKNIEEMPKSFLNYPVYQLISYQA